MRFLMRSREQPLPAAAAATLSRTGKIVIQLNSIIVKRPRRINNADSGCRAYAIPVMFFRSAVANTFLSLLRTVKTNFPLFFFVFSPRRRPRRCDKTVDAQRGLRRPVELGRGTRAFVRGRDRVPRRHRGPGSLTVGRRRRVRAGVARQRSAGFGAERQLNRFRVVSRHRRLCGAK